MGRQCIKFQMDSKHLKKLFNCINKEKCKVKMGCYFNPPNKKKKLYLIFVRV